jgi:hypothetical protein
MLTNHIGISDDYKNEKPNAASMEVVWETTLIIITTVLTRS